MHKTLLFVLLIVLLLKPAATTNPAFAAALSLAPMGSVYPDPDGLLNCDYCNRPLRDCYHYFVQSLLSLSFSGYH